jgi:energy-coupling factor transporter ATP-binding protein EcfA2
VTTIIVTHDQEEAFDLADKVVIFNRGFIEQVIWGRVSVLARGPPRLARFVAVGAASRPRHGVKPAGPGVQRPPRCSVKRPKRRLGAEAPTAEFDWPVRAASDADRVPHRDHPAPGNAFCDEVCGRHKRRPRGLAARAQEQVGCGCSLQLSTRRRCKPPLLAHGSPRGRRSFHLAASAPVASYSLFSKRKL